MPSDSSFLSVTQRAEKAALLSLYSYLLTLTPRGSPEVLFIDEILILLNWPIKVVTAKLQTSVATQRDSLR